MCGIVGILHTRSRATPERDLLARMNDRQQHRGPDEAGLHLEPGVGLGHRRLSIIDLATGQQPLFNEDHSVVVVFNGEIYNFADLTRELQAAGHVFRTHSDTEVIVHAWEQWGAACVERFRGMFAFAIWDRNQRRLFLARDRLGIKPLYYTLLPDGQLLFGSELKSLLEHPGLLREIDPRAVEDYFAYGYVPEPKSILAGVYKLEPGHSLNVAADATELPSPQRYWDVRFANSYRGSFADAQAELLERLREAVRIRLVAEVPLGAFLSGGVDSSAVVATMAGLDPRPVKTCSIAFDDPQYNEADFAAQVAERYHTDHRVDKVDPDDFSLVERLAELYDEPYADSSAMPTYRVCEAARRRVTVALSGDGGDENLAGYRRYRLHLYEERLRRLLPLQMRRPLFGTLGHYYPKADWAPRHFRAKATLQGLARDSVEGYFHSVSLMTDEHRAALFSDDFRRELQGYHASAVFHAHAAQAQTDDPLSFVQYLDLKTFLVSILHKVDRASMAHALEVRVPLLDHHLVEWLATLPPAWKLHGHDGKYLFKKAMEPHLPHNVMYRPKRGFSVPLASWFRGPLRERLRAAVLGPTLAETGLFNPDYLRQLVDRHQSGRRDNSAMLWELLMYASFVERTLGR
ncbi:MAG: hypothetical protein RLZ44_1886 [Pseudomonadota bacterium]